MTRGLSPVISVSCSFIKASGRGFALVDGGQHVYEENDDDSNCKDDYNINKVDDADDDVYKKDNSYGNNEGSCRRGVWVIGIIERYLN